MHSLCKLSCSSLFCSALALALVAPSCGGGGTAPDGGSGGSGGGGGGGRSLCSDSPTTPTVPADFGESCGAGSSYALCAITSTDQCAGGSCLWDQKLGEAYCTVACDGSGQSCPSQYTCSSQSCSSGPPKVCVRTGSDKTVVCETITTDYTLTPSDAAIGPDGRLYVFAEKASGATTVFSRTQTETTWTKIFERPAFALPSGNWADTLTTADAVYFVLWSGKLLRIVGVDVTEETYETCAGNGDCKYGGLQMFRTPAGTVRGFSYYGPVFERDGQGTWTAVMTEAPTGFAFGAPFRLSGFWGFCQPPGAQPTDPTDRICWGSQGDDPRGEPLPNGEIPAAWPTAVAGDNPTDFLVFSTSGNLFHRIGDAWIKEGLPAPAASAQGGEVIRAADGALWAFRDREGPIFRLTGSCWQLVPGSLYSTGLPLDNQTLGYISMSQWCEAPLP